VVSEASDIVRSKAIAWRIRLRDGSTEDWEAFADWVGEDPRNGAAYDQIALLDQDLERPLVALSRVVADRTNDNAPMSPSGTRRWMVAGIAATLTAAAATFLFLPSLPTPRNDFYDVSTRSGEHRTLHFGDGNRVTLNGNSRIRLDHNDARFASLESGEASFKVTHDPEAPFTLKIGNNRLVDVGTSFNVVRYAQSHIVAVAEGAVLYNPEEEAVRLTAGQSLRSDDRERRIQLASVNPTEVGSWQRGLLIYRGAPLSDIASDLTRNLGKHVRVSPQLASRSFTGTIEIGGDEGQLFERLGKLLGTASRRTPDGWILDEPTAS